jgi:hypothetical protein
VSGLVLAKVKETMRRRAAVKIVVFMFLIFYVLIDETKIFRHKGERNGKMVK